jgi:WD40 repeat protein
MQPVSPDGRYALNWNSKGEVYIADLRTGQDVWWLIDNYPVWILRAAFSHDMRRILCFNWGGTVGVWSVPAALRGRPRSENIIEAVVRQEDTFTLRHAHLGYRGRWRE